MRLSVIEGMAFAAMVGLGEAFFLADAIRLSASRLQQGLVVTLPLCVGSLGPLLSLLLLGRLRSRKPLVVASTLAQALVLLALAAASLAGRSSIGFLIAAATLYNVAGQFGGAAWSSWFGDLVPAEKRGRYFAVRNGWIYGTTFLGMLASGMVLARLEPTLPAEARGAGGVGYAVVYGLAACFRLTSAALHVVSPEPRYGGLTTRSRASRFIATRQGQGLGRLLLIGGAFYFAVYIASPFFAPFMLEELRFSYGQYTLASAAVIVAKVTLLPFWGRTIDQLGARPVFLLAATLVACVPLPFLWADGLGWVIYAQLVSGLAWAGYELGVFTLLLERTYRRVRPYAFALQSLSNGVAQLTGSLAGVWIASYDVVELRWLFGISLLARLAVSAVMPFVLVREPGERVVRHREVLVRVVGFRVAGGLGLRPIPEPELPPPEEPGGQRVPSSDGSTAGRDRRAADAG